eukprot:5674479-Prymnesium_polylepis.1
MSCARGRGAASGPVADAVLRRRRPLGAGRRLQRAQFLWLAPRWLIVRRGGARIALPCPRTSCARGRGAASGPVADAVLRRRRPLGAGRLLQRAHSLLHRD